MKKTLRLLLCLLTLTFAASAQADEINILTNSSSGEWTEIADPAAGYTATIDGFTITYYKGSGNAPVAPSTDHIRSYKNNYLLIEGVNNEVITKVVLNCTKADYCGDITVNDSETGTADTDALTVTWEGSTESFLALMGAQNRITSIDITYGAGTTYTVATPVISPEGGTYTEAQTVTISCETDGAAIYYTLDGSTPTAESTLYTAALTISEATTLSAIAYVGDEASRVATATYLFAPTTTGDGTADNPYTVSDALAIINAGTYSSEAVYIKGIVNYVTELSTSYGNATYSLVDNTGDTDTLIIFRGYYLDGEKFTSEDQLQAGDAVVVSGVLTLYYSTAEVTSGSSIVSLTRDGTTIEPEEDDTDDNTSDGSGSADSPYTVSEALAIINAGTYTSDSVYVKGIVSTVSEISTSHGNATYFISDDGTTASELEIYRGYYLDGAKFTSADELQVGDTIIVRGILTLYYSTAEMTTGSQITYLSRPESTDTDDDTDTETAYNLYAKTTTIAEGSYLLVVQDDANTLYATTISNSYTYGYLYVNTVSGLVDTLSIDTAYNYAYTLTASATTDGAYTIQDSYGRYLYQNGTYKSFQLSDTNDGYDWNIALNDDGTVTLTYIASGYYTQYSTSYSSFGCYADAQTGALMPYLYAFIGTDGTTDEEEDTDNDDTTTDGTTFTLVTDAATLAAGDVITFANSEYQTAIGEQNSNNRNFLTTAVTIADGVLTATESVSTFTLSTADDGNWLIQYDLTGYYLTSNTASSNYLSTEETADGLYSEVTIAIADDGNATIVFQGDNERRWMRFNTNGYFSVYAEGGQQDLQIYRKDLTEETGIQAITTTESAVVKGIYTLSGMRLSTLDNAPAGIYVVDGKKVMVK